MERITERPANRRKCRRYIRKVSSSRSPISSGRRRRGVVALTYPIVGDRRTLRPPCCSHARGWRQTCGMCASHARRWRQTCGIARRGLGLGGSPGARRFLVAVLDRRELEAVLAFHVDLNRVTARDLSAQQVLGKVVFDPARDDAPQRAGAIDPVVAFLRKQVLRRIRDLDRYLLLHQVLAELVQLQIDDLPDLSRRQALEHDDCVDAIEKLWAKHPLELFVDLLFRVLVTALDFFRLVNDRRLEAKRGGWL